MAKIVNCPLCNKPVLVKDAGAHVDSDCKSLIVKGKSEQSNVKTVKATSKNAWNSMFAGSSSGGPVTKSNGKTKSRHP